MKLHNQVKVIFYGGFLFIALTIVAFMFVIRWENKNATYTDIWWKYEVRVLPNNEAMLYRSDLKDSIHIKVINTESLDQVILINKPIKHIR